MKRHALFCAAVFVSSLGCTPAGTWGNEARYAPDFRGYVIARSPDSRARILLENPITEKKIRCREDLEPYFTPVAGEIATRVHDENMALAGTLPPTMTVMFPLAGTGVLLAMVEGELLAPSEGLHLLMRSPGRDSLYERGQRAFTEKRFAEAERLFERALAKPHGDVDTQRSTYFLGILYEQEGRRQDAAHAYRRFIERAEVRDEKAYDEAEKHLMALDPAAFKPCRSQEPLTFTWPAPRR
ncbi:MAG: tetratricopeptide repeat protein [Minicystis sp.]